MYSPLPDTVNFSDVLGFIEALPDYDTPDIFGMTENAEKACREFQANDIVETVTSMQPRMSSGLTGLVFFLVRLIFTVTHMDFLD